MEHLRGWGAHTDEVLLAQFQLEAYLDDKNLIQSKPVVSFRAVHYLNTSVTHLLSALCALCLIRSWWLTGFSFCSSPCGVFFFSRSSGRNDWKREFSTVYSVDWMSICPSSSSFIWYDRDVTLPFVVDHSLHTEQIGRCRRVCVRADQFRWRLLSHLFILQQISSQSIETSLFNRVMTFLSRFIRLLDSSLRSCQWQSTTMAWLLRRKPM